MVTVWLLHGFLQDASAWNRLRESLNSRFGDDVRINAEEIVAHEDSTLESWARGFCDTVPQRTEQRLLVGYSMGGRLAMHALLAKPDLWAHAILVSAHPGSDDVTWRASAKSRDEEWAHRFESEPPEVVLADWGAQVLFNLSTGARKRVVDPVQAALDLRRFSKSAQPNLLPLLAALPVGLTYVVGEQDELYLAVADRVAKETSASIEVVPHSGHRVPWDQPDAFFAIVSSAITKLLSIRKR